MKTKPMVLCITREALINQEIPAYDNTSGIYKFNLSKLNQENYHFINRYVVDSEVNTYQEIAYHLPQILPYIVITDGQGKYLSYSRNGTETRLHGSMSIGIGGHIDIDDLTDDNFFNLSIEATIHHACQRELEEEILFKDYDNYLAIDFEKLIVDTTNPVGSVHVGLFTTLVYPEAKPQEELHNPVWLTAEELKANIDNYENWSKLIIETL